MRAKHTTGMAASQRSFTASERPSRVPTLATLSKEPSAESDATANGKTFVEVTVVRGNECDKGGASAARQMV